MAVFLPVCCFSSLLSSLLKWEFIGTTTLPIVEVPGSFVLNSTPGKLYMSCFSCIICFCITMYLIGAYSVVKFIGF